MRLPDYWEPSDNIEDRRRTPNPEHQQFIRERRLGSIYDQADDADARQGIRLDDGNGGVYDPNKPIQTLMGKGNPVADPFGGGGSDPSGFLARLGPFASPQLGMMILQNPQKAVEMLAGRGIPLMHSDFGAFEFPPSPSYPPPQEPVKGPGGSTVPSEAPENRPGLGSPPPEPEISRSPVPPPAPPTTREPLPPPVQDRPPIVPPMAEVDLFPQPTPVAPPVSVPAAPPPAPVGTPTPPPGTEASGGWWDPIDKGISRVLRQFIPGANTLDPNRPISPTMSGQSSPYGGMDPQDYNTPAPSAPSSAPYNGMDPEDYNTPAPSPFDPTPADQPPLDITAAAGKAPAAKPAANGIAAMLSGLKPIETKANVPATPSAPHPTAGNSTNLADLIAMMTGGHKAASTPLDGLGLLLARGKL